jgi:integrase
MLRRVCKRAGVQQLSPHQLRHGFANREIEADELARALEDAYEARNAQASPDWTTLDASTLKYPRNRLVEAAGIEPASAAAPAEHLQA